MPLLHGSSQSVIGQNIREMRQAGHPEAQAVAAALHNADKSKKKGDPPKHKKQPKTRTIEPKEKGQKAITYHPGGLHESTHTPAGEKIPESKKAAARAGKYGPKAEKQANFARNVFHVS